MRLAKMTTHHRSAALTPNPSPAIAEGGSVMMEIVVVHFHQS